MILRCHRSANFAHIPELSLYVCNLCVYAYIHT